MTAGAKLTGFWGRWGSWMMSLRLRLGSGMDGGGVDVRRELAARAPKWCQLSTTPSLFGEYCPINRIALGGTVSKLAAYGADSRDVES